MAAIGAIRKRSAILILIIGLGLFAFIAEEFFRSCESTQTEKRMQIGKILGEKISVQEYQELLDEYKEVAKITQGRDNFTEDETNRMEDAVWENLVNRKILENETQKLGLTVTDEELQNVLKEGTHPVLLQTPFVNSKTGRFDVSALQKFLADYKNSVGQNTETSEQYQMLYTYWTFIEKNLRNQILASKYQTLLIDGCLLSNPVAAKAYYSSHNEESAITLAAFPYSSIKDTEVEVTDDDIAKKYAEMKEMFKQYVETRDIKYVDVKVTASAEDREELMKTMIAAADSLKAGNDPATVVRKAQSSILYTGLPVTSKALPRDIARKVDSMAVGEVSAPFETRSDNTLNVVKLIAKTQLPDSVEYRQIQVVGTSIDDVRGRADSIYTALKGGADFTALAEKYGQSGEAQWMTSAMYESAQTIDVDSKKYLETIITSGVNDLKNVEMSQGNIILQVSKRTNFKDKYTAAVVKHTIDFSKATYSDAYNKFSQYVSENQSLESLEKNAEKYGYRVRERQDMTSSDHYVVNVRGTRDAMKWIFDAKPNDVSPLYECGENDHLMVIALTKVHPVGYRDAEDAKEMLTAEVQKDKKFEVLSGKLYGVKSVDDARGKGANVADVDQITFSNPVFVQATGMSEPALTGAVATVPQGQFCTNVVKGVAGAYVFAVTKKGPRENTQEYDEKAAEEQLRKQAGQAASRFMYELYTKAGVVDNRYLFF